MAPLLLTAPREAHRLAPTLLATPIKGDPKATLRTLALLTLSRTPVVVRRLAKATLLIPPHPSLARGTPLSPATIPGPLAATTLLLAVLAATPSTSTTRGTPLVAMAATAPQALAAWDPLAPAALRATIPATTRHVATTLDPRDLDLSLDHLDRRHLDLPPSKTSPRDAGFAQTPANPEVLFCM